MAGVELMMGPRRHARPVPPPSLPRMKSSTAEVSVALLKPVVKTAAASWMLESWLFLISMRLLLASHV
jgi:hypothetical protein